MNIHNALSQMRLGLSQRLEIDFAIDRIRLTEAIRLNPVSNIGLADDLKTYGPLACAQLNNGITAVANEDGFINLLQTRNKMENVAHWQGHSNSIFDIKASYDKRTVLTASGDSTMRQWDLETKTDILNFKPHFSSIKSISIYDSNTVASGSRDGSIKVHDLRQKNPTVIEIREAHRNYMIAKTRKSTTKTDPISCVTNVVFDQYLPRIYSTGANDATIKLWDIRRYSALNKPKRTSDGQLLISKPSVEVHHPSKGMHCGYSHLLISNCKIYAACSDNKIYCYDNFCQSSQPIKFTGYNYDTYLKLAVMDDRFLFSGSKGGGAIMWTLGKKPPSKYYPETTKQPIGQLKPDNNDIFDTNVIETDWTTMSILTFRDDRLVCKWTMDSAKGSQKKEALASSGLETDNDITIQLADIIDVNVLRPSQLSSNSNSTQRQQTQRVSQLGTTGMMVD